MVGKLQLGCRVKDGHFGCDCLEMGDVGEGELGLGKQVIEIAALSRVAGEVMKHHVSNFYLDYYDTDMCGMIPLVSYK